MKSSTPHLTGARTQLEEHYADLESGLPVILNSDYERLVSSNGNGGAPIHRWFHLKEAFSAHLLGRVLQDTGLAREKSLRVLDPFAGGGTTGVSLGAIRASGAIRRATFYGIECNPFLQLVASTKLRATQGPSTTFGSLARRVAAAAHRKAVEAAPTPHLTTFHNDDYFEQDALSGLLRLRRAIEIESERDADSLDVDLARVCLAASVEPSSGLRRDGRALRYVPGKVRKRPVSEFLARAEQVEHDMADGGARVAGRVILGDGRTTSGLPSSAANLDLVLFSPPYPNNIDYTEVYKMEAWLLGLFTDSEAFAAQRLKTVYSHPSLKRDPNRIRGGAVSPNHIDELAEPVIASVPTDRYRSSRRLMIRGYLDDMSSTVAAAYQRLRPGGRLVYVVGNSLHGHDGNGFVIAADILIAQLARQTGFEIERIDVARTLRRRHSTSPYLRESVVFARKPEA